MIKAYYQLTKPGIIYGNALPAIAGFLLASKGRFDVKLFVAMIVGLSLVVASACVFNNIYDRGIDAKMPRTKNRALVRGEISKTAATIFGGILIVCGILVLSLHTNRYSLFVALLGFVVYAFFYTPLKAKTVYATLVGSIAGAVPPVVGYTAVLARLDTAAVILFLILVFWQMPHFYAIAIRRQEDYAAANVPVLPIKQGIRNTKTHIISYIIGFILASAALSYFKFTGRIYLVVMLILGLMWLWFGVQGFWVPDNKAWAKKMFLFSLVVLLVQSLLISINAVLP